MPEFVLPLESIDSHKWFDGLPAIARGYVEAAFFTGVYYWAGDGEPVEPETGPANLDPETRAGLEAQAVRFWIAHRETLAAAMAAGDYDLEQAGRDFWLTRNGCGIGFSDRELGDPGEALEAACHWQGEFGEVALSCEPTPAALAAAGAGATGDAVAEAAEALEAAEAGTGWRVGLDYRESPLTEAERAALAALEADATGGPASPLSDVPCAYGAPLGRGSDRLEPGEPVTVQRVTLDAGGYDAGGAYWGHGAPLWRVSGKVSGGRVYLRAKDSRAALETARREMSA